jgi:phenylalanyl-tRNA synthetase beta chain
MRVSLNWLKELVDLPTTDVAELTRAFDMLGHTVEEAVEYTADWSDVKIGRVERIEAHPGADKVRVTHVDLGDGELQQIICGAWNFEEGAVVPVAIPGAVLPGGFEIGRRSIRGVESNGMICSEQELGLGEDHDGIMVLSGDEPLGAPFESILVTNNRPDVMGMVGVAREIAAWFDVPFTPPVVELDTVPGAPAVAITNSAPDGCNRFTAREVRGVTLGKSPLWVRERLRKAGIRAISNAVDVTNYVMVEMGHPLHAFDADRVAGNVLDVRWAVDGEELETLDGSIRRLSSQDLVIADGDGPTSLAAVMGGARSEVADDTVNILMEAANWDRATVMYTSRRHDLQSEASKRFERGVDVNLATLADDRACQMLVELGGGEILETQIDVLTNPVDPWTIELPIHEVHRILGDRFTMDHVAGLLRRLQLGVEHDDATLTLTIPTNRRDLSRPADLIEEIARLADFDTFEATLPTGPAGGLSAQQARNRRVRQLLRGLGLHQAINLPFVSPEEAAAFGADPDLEVTVKNPLREDQAKLRQHVLPVLLRNVRDNRNRGAQPVALFETGRVFVAEPWSDDERVPHQPLRLAVAIWGEFGDAALGTPPEAADASTALALIDVIAATLGVEVGREPAAPAGFHPTRTARLMLDGVAVGHAGEVHPEVADMYEIEGRVAILELDLEPLLEPTPFAVMGQVSTYPHVDFDLSFAVPLETAGSSLLEATSAAAANLEDAHVFDDYVDAGTGDRSLAIRYRLRAPDRTLTKTEIADERAAMVAAAADLGATLRGG